MLNKIYMDMGACVCVNENVFKTVCICMGMCKCSTTEVLELPKVTIFVFLWQQMQFLK